MNETLSIEKPNNSRFLRFCAVNIVQQFFDDLGAGTMLHRFQPGILAEVLPVSPDDIRLIIRNKRVATVGIDLADNAAMLHIDHVDKLIQPQFRRKFRELGIVLSSSLYRIDGIEDSLRSARDGMLRVPRSVPRRQRTRNPGLKKRA